MSLQAEAGQAVWGDPLQDELMQTVRAEGLDARVRFLGFVDDVEPLLAASDIHVCPSIHPEGLTNVVPEAKRAGAALESAVAQVLSDASQRTTDMGGSLSTEQMTEAIHVANAIRGGSSLVHGVQMKNVHEKVSM